jgi:hypothetical protein
MLLFGLFACYDPKSSNTIKFFSVDEIYRRNPDAKDWTDKLTTGNQIESITFTFQDYAQKNHIRYLKDETVTVNAGGAIEINNTTLEKEKDLAELKFAASDEKNGFIYIPLYTRNEKGEIEYKKTTSRIALMNFSNASSIARFPLSFYPAGMAFDGINYGRIRKYYQKYREIIAQPKVIEATFLLNEPDLYGLDLLTPVYLEQTGKYYAIIDMNASEKGAKCKLLQM